MRALVLLALATLNLHAADAVPAPAASEPAAVDAAALPVAIAPGDPLLAYSGRWETTSPDGPRTEWPAGTVRLVTDATAVNVVLGGGKGHAMQVVVDGKPTAVITLAKGQSVYPVATGLAPGRHRIELCKRTEGWGGPIQVKGFQLATGGTLEAPPAFKRRVEFLGDSITCGYGNEAENQQAHFSLPTENAWLSYGAVTARALEADYSCVAISGGCLQEKGVGMWIPAVWERTFPISKGPAWDFSRWQADAVVVNLGTNDEKKPIDPERWKAAYRALIASIHRNYPKAHVFLAIGPMTHGPKGIIKDLNEELATAMRGEGDLLVHAVPLAKQGAGHGYGADWHPNVWNHQAMADTMTAAIRRELGW